MSRILSQIIVGRQATFRFCKFVKILLIYVRFSIILALLPPLSREDRGQTFLKTLGSIIVFFKRLEMVKVEKSRMVLNVY